MPVPIDEIEELLHDRGYQVVHETKKNKGFQLGSHLPLYLIKTSKTGVTALVVHPESKIQEWVQLQTDILPSEGYFHSSNLVLFPKRNNGGAQPIGYGLGLTFDSLQAVVRCLIRLEGAERIAAENSNDHDKSLIDNFPKGSDIETTAMRREGHLAFRALLEKFWGTCAVTGVAHPVMLRASHIKPWSESSATEKTNPFNGLLLAAHLDVAFDRGLITFNEQGVMIRSSQLSSADVNKLGLTSECKLSRVEPQHLPFLAFHRQNIFKN
jgi:putative restriction endonuclease